MQSYIETCNRLRKKKTFDSHHGLPPRGSLISASAVHHRRNRRSTRTRTVKIKGLNLNSLNTYRFLCQVFRMDIDSSSSLQTDSSNSLPSLNNDYTSHFIGTYNITPHEEATHADSCTEIDHTVRPRSVPQPFGSKGDSVGAHVRALVRVGFSGLSWYWH